MFIKLKNDALFLKTHEWIEIIRRKCVGGYGQPNAYFNDEIF